MRKRLLSLALTAGMTLTLLPASALAAEPGNVTWLDESIVSYDGYYGNADSGFTAEGLAVVENDEGLYGYINQYGEIAIPCQYQAACAFQEGVAAVQNQEGWWGYIDTQGDVFLPFEYGGATPFDGGKYHIYAWQKRRIFRNYWKLHSRQAVYGRSVLYL